MDLRFPRPNSRPGVLRENGPGLRLLGGTTPPNTGNRGLKGDALSLARREAQPRNARMVAQAVPAPPPSVGIPEDSFARPAAALELVAARALGVPVASARAKGLAKKMASSLAETMTPHTPDPLLAPRVSVASQIAGLPGNPVNNSRV